jgi:hypothetical protein
MTSKHAEMGAWPGAPADRDLPPGRHDLHRENLMNYIRNEHPPTPAGRSARLPASARQLAARTGRHSRRRQLAAAAASVAVAAGVVGYAMSARDAASPARQAAALPSATLAAMVLRDAANHVAHEAVTAEPSRNQWIYTKTIDAGYYGRIIPPADQEWVTFDGRQNAYYQAQPGSKYYVPGRLVVHLADPNPPGRGVPPWNAWTEAPSPMTAWNLLASLPRNPQQLLAAVYAHLGKDGDFGSLSGTATQMKAQAEFDDLVDVLWNAIGRPGGPPAAVAAVYRAFAALPGVSVRTGMTDVAGAPAIGISDDGQSYLLLSPASYQVIGSVTYSTGINPFAHLRELRFRHIDELSGAKRALARRVLAPARTRGMPKGPYPPKGAILNATAIVIATEVAAPGDV